MNLKIIFFSVLVVFVVPFLSIHSDTCYTCGPGSTNGCQQCKINGKDNNSERKACQDAGCKISGTTVCSQSANVKVCQG